jgi:hypothetical protein
MADAMSTSLTFKMKIVKKVMDQIKTEKTCRTMKSGSAKVHLSGLFSIGSDTGVKAVIKTGSVLTSLNTQ